MPLVIFDIDGTLTETTGLDDSAFVAAAAAALGIDPRGIDTDWSHYPHATDGSLLEEIARRATGQPPTAEQTARARAEFFGALRAAAAAGAIRPVAGARELLAALDARGWRTALATGAWRESAVVKLKAAGLWNPGRAFAHADDAHSRAEITRAAAARAGGWGLEDEPTGPGTVYVGDGVWDAETSLGLGLGFVGVRVRGDDARLRAAGATVVARDYVETEAMLALLASGARVPDAQL
jgi:phosphoglycolate phosphatase-like HAD superfamily hydrolase